MTCGRVLLTNQIMISVPPTPGFKTHVEPAGGGWLQTSPSSYLQHAPQPPCSIAACVRPCVCVCVCCLWLQGELVKLPREPGPALSSHQSHLALHNRPAALSHIGARDGGCGKREREKEVKRRRARGRGVTLWGREGRCSAERRRERLIIWSEQIK